MYLTNELQKHLRSIGSTIHLYNSFESPGPANYVYYTPTGDRNFRVDFGRTTMEYSVVLFIRTKEQNYEMCYFRGLFNSLDQLARVLKAWIDEKQNVDVIATQYNELEPFLFDEFVHPNPAIEERWCYVKNRIFNDLKFWQNQNFEMLYFKMLEHAKRNKEWSHYYPFTSHDWFRFSLNEELSVTWVLALVLIPTRTTEKGNYFVGVPEEECKEGYFFDDVEEAIKFYGRKLKEYKPIAYN
ncbi:MAG: hypothetical protein AAGA77_04360 [Bacteroidota bacterium]